MAVLLRSSLLFLARLVFRLMPETRLFGCKAALLRAAGAQIGHNVRVCSSATVLGSGRLEVGDDTWIGPQVLICAGSSVRIGCRVDIAPRVYIGTGTHEIDRRGNRAAGHGVDRSVVIEEGAWLGAASAILPGVTVGSHAVVAAGAVVAEDVAPNSLVGGVPARLIRTAAQARPRARSQA